MQKIFVAFCLGILFYSGYGQVLLTPVVDSIPMRDGKKLAADIYIPSGLTQGPVILIQTPYNRLYYRYSLPLKVGLNINTSPYIFVIADWRGFYGSVNAMVSNPNRGEDGYDLVEWIAQQSWSDGKIGTWGPSALGKIQYQTARENPPHLTCICPLVAGSQFTYKEYFQGGVYRKEYVEQLDALGYNMSPFLLANPYYNVSWQYVEAQNWYPSLIKVPAFMIGGWYDHNIDDMLDLFNGLRDYSPVSDKHKILIGPWSHNSVGKENQGELAYPDAAGWSDSLALKFFDYYLRNNSNGWEQEPLYKYYVLGVGGWVNDSIWPHNNCLEINGELHDSLIFIPQIAVKNTDYVQFQYDPKDPSPTIGGSTLRQDLTQGPYNQAALVENRNDIAVFTSETDNVNYDIFGKPKVRLFVSSNCKDTDFAIRLTDVAPDGKSMLICDGIKRMRFLHGYSVSDTISLKPDSIYEVEVDFPNIALAMQNGHYLRLDVSSSNYPRFDCNLNNGGAMYTAGDTLIATNKIYFQYPYTSVLVFPACNMVSVRENERKNSDINIYPNPANDFIQVAIPENEQKFQVGIYNISGHLVAQFYNQDVISVGQFPEGIYFLKYISGKTIIGKRFIIIR